MVLGSAHKTKIDYRAYGKVGKIKQIKRANQTVYAQVCTGKKKFWCPIEYLQKI